ncbi:MAG: heavy-metal-associated domain-containing protein [Bacteroidales bacterium]|nr:heavy-metal-associated domain-containing protein [Bacteroidales bacterium]
MKTTNKIFTVMIIALFMITAINTNVSAQKAEKYDECKIKVSATCNSCKAKIEKNIAFEKGIKDVTVNLETKVATLKYKSDKTNPEKLLKAIEKLGYKAELVKPIKATEKLKKCNEPVPCRKKKCGDNKGGK